MLSFISSAKRSTKRWTLETWSLDTRGTSQIYTLTVPFRSCFSSSRSTNNVYFVTGNDDVNNIKQPDEPSIYFNDALITIIDDDFGIWLEATKIGEQMPRLNICIGPERAVVKILNRQLKEQQIALYALDGPEYQKALEEMIQD